MTSITIKNLIPHKEYFVKILNRDFYWNFSVSCEWDFCAYIGGNPVPSVLICSEDGSNFVTLSWSNSTSKYLLYYDVYKSLTKNSIPDGLINCVGITYNTSQKIKNLKSNTTYFFKVGTYTKWGRFSESNEIEVKTLP